MVAETPSCWLPSGRRDQHVQPRGFPNTPSAITLRPGKWGRDISSGATIGILIGTAALLGLGGVAVFLFGRGQPRTRDDRLVQAVDEMRSRMDDLGRDLSDALDRAERESKRNRFLSDLGSSVEFEELLDRVLDAALEVPGFDAAMVLARRSCRDADGRDPWHDGRGGGAPALLRRRRVASHRADHRQLPLRRVGRRRHAPDPRGVCSSRW